MSLKIDPDRIIQERGLGTVSVHADDAIEDIQLLSRRCSGVRGLLGVPDDMLRRCTANRR